MKEVIRWKEEENHKVCKIIYCLIIFYINFYNIYNSIAGLTYCAVASLKLLGMEINDKDKLIFWLVNRMVDLGVNGRTGKIPDSCYSFWSYATLCLIDKEDLVNKSLIKQFLLNCQCQVVNSILIK